MDFRNCFWAGLSLLLIAALSLVGLLGEPVEASRGCCAVASRMADSGFLGDGILSKLTQDFRFQEDCHKDASCEAEVAAGESNCGRSKPARCSFRSRLSCRPARANREMLTSLTAGLRKHRSCTCKSCLHEDILPPSLDFPEQDSVEPISPGNENLEKRKREQPGDSPVSTT